VRKNYEDQLEQLTDGVVAMSRLAAGGVRGATTAVVCGDLAAADAVVYGDEVLDSLYQSIDELALDILARQQPVAADLRRVVTALRMAIDLERAGDYAVHIAELVQRRHPVAVLPAQVCGLVQDMGDRVAEVTAKVGVVVRRRDLVLAQQVAEDDEAVDELQRQLFAAVLSERFEVEQVVDVTLVGRYYERLADHAAAVAGAVSYLVTGQHGAAIARSPG
jgi:phosphate transport system protein